MISNKIHIKICNCFVNALVDTGCSTSVLSEKLLHRIHIPLQKLDPGDPNFLFGANGTRIPIVGKTSLPIKLHGLTVPYQFLVAKTLTHEILLGNDFLRETKALINYSDSSITFYDNMVEMKLLHRHHDIVACVAEPCHLPPLSESIIHVNLSKNITSSNILLEAFPMHER